MEAADRKDSAAVIANAIALTDGFFCLPVLCSTLPEIFIGGKYTTSLYGKYNKQDEGDERQGGKKSHQLML